MSEKEEIKRYISFDLGRGLAIIAVIGFHVLNVCYNADAAINSAIDSMNISFILLVIILAFLGQSYPAFILLSAAGNTISMERRWLKLTADGSEKSKKVAYKAILTDQIIRGLILILISYFSETLLNTGLTYLIVQDPNHDVIKDMLSQFYHSQIIGLIGFGVIISAIIYLNCVKRNFSKEKIKKILYIFTAIFIFGYPLMVELFKAIPGLWNHPEEYIVSASIGIEVLYWFLSPFANGWFPYFPNAGLSLLGVVIGIEIANAKISKDFFRKLLRSGWLFFICGIIWLIIDEFIFEGNSYRYYDSIFMATASSILLLAVFFYYIDVKGNGNKIANRTKFFRRFGLLSLTTWCLQWTAAIPLRIIHEVTNWINKTSIPFYLSDIYLGYLSGWMTWVMIFVAIGFISLILWMISLTNYKISFEYLLAKIMTLGNKKSESSKINIALTLDKTKSLISENEGQNFIDFKARIILMIMFIVFMLGSIIGLIF